MTLGCETLALKARALNLQDFTARHGAAAARE